jgi:hypothetical protein
VASSTNRGDARLWVDVVAQLTALRTDLQVLEPLAPAGDAAREQLEWLSQAAASALRASPSPLSADATVLELCVTAAHVAGAASDDKSLAESIQDVCEDVRWAAAEAPAGTAPGQVIKVLEELRVRAQGVRPDLGVVWQPMPTASERPNMAVLAVAAGQLAAAMQPSGLTRTYSE